MIKPVTLLPRTWDMCWTMQQHTRALQAVVMAWQRASPHEQFDSRPLSECKNILTQLQNIHGRLIWAVSHDQDLERTSLATCQQPLNAPPTHDWQGIRLFRRFFHKGPIRTFSPTAPAQTKQRHILGTASLLYATHASPVLNGQSEALFL